MDQTAKRVKMESPYQAPDSDLNNTGMLTCQACQKQMHSSVAICPHCGFSRRSSRYKSKHLAAALAFFLGGFGVHRFYLRQWWGVFYLLLFWLAIPGIIAFVECFYFLFRNRKKWDDKYNDGLPRGPNEKLGGALIAILIILCLFVFIAIIGILAAIALPAYQDYTNRAAVASVYAETYEIRAKVNDYYQSEQQIPSSNLAIGLDAPHTLVGGSSAALSATGLTITFSQSTQSLNGKTLILVPDEIQATLSWQCQGGTLYEYIRTKV